MNARLPTLACLLLAACAACATTPGDTRVVRPSAPEGSRNVLHGSECLDPRMARGWMDLADDTLLVDAGRFKYRIQTTGACGAVAWTPMLMLRGDPIAGRVCGGVGDAIITRDYACSIRDIRLVSAEDYKALVKQRDEARKRKRASR